jgi:hypothetical protein
MSTKFGPRNHRFDFALALFFAALLVALYVAARHVR